MNRIPATIVTGFLGAGKTTLIRNLLATANGKRLALIVNEFGEIGVDGDLLKSCGIPGCEEDDIVELANGCICCTVADDFLPTMQALLRRPLPPQHIVIETSGLALPKPLVQAFAWPEVRTRMTVDGVITVVDAPAVAEGRFADDPDAVAAQRAADPSLDHDDPLAELFEDQLACADIVILNKVDLVDAETLARVEAEIAIHTRPGVTIVRAREGKIGAGILLGLGAGAEDDIAQRPSHHDHEEDHDHDEFTSFGVALPADATSPEAIVERLAPVIAAHDILRVKGFVAVAGKPMRLVVQAAGPRIQHHYDRAWRGGERASRLVVIGRSGLDEAAIRSALAG
jgi:cobalamin biosynthesis protein CobW